MLFNTLANLRALIATEPASAIAMLDRLNDYLRATLRASRSGGTQQAPHTLADEFQRLDDYLALMAVRTRHRADIGPLVAAGWAALITLAGVALFVILGSLFGQFDFAFGEGVRRVAIVPILNLIIALMLSPIIVRLQHSVRKFA